MKRFALLLALAVSLATPCLAQGAATGSVPLTRWLTVPGAAHPADVTVTVNRPDGSELVVPGMRLHGVVWFDRKVDLQPDLDLARSLIRPAKALVASQPRGSTWRATVTPKGRDLSDVCELAPDGHADSAPALNWCLWLRSRWRAPGKIDTLHVPQGVYRYAGPVALRDSVHIAGAGGAVRGPREQDEFGNRFTPVLDLPDAASTTFRQLDGTSFTFLGRAMLASEMEAHADEPALRPDEALRLALRQDRTAWYLEPGAAYIGLSDLALDGQGEADLARLLRARRSPDPAVQKTLFDGLQNSPSHTGVTITEHGGLAVRQLVDPRPSARGPSALPGERTWETAADGFPDGDGWRTIRARHTGQLPGAFAHLDGVSVVGFAATGLLGDYHAHWTLRDVYGADCLYNHTVYKATGDWDHVTLEGYSWHHVVMQGTDLGTVRDLVLRRMASNPSGRETGAALDIRGGNGEDQWIDGLYADLRGFPGGFLADVAPRVYYTNVRTGELATEDYDFVGLSLRRATVVTPARWLLRLRGLGPIDLDSVRVHTPFADGGSGRFGLATPDRYADMTRATAITVLDTTATATPGPLAPPSTPHPVLVDPPTVDMSETPDERQAPLDRIEEKAQADEPPSWRRSPCASRPRSTDDSPARPRGLPTRFVCSPAGSSPDGPAPVVS